MTSANFEFLAGAGSRRQAERTTLSGSTTQATQCKGEAPPCLSLDAPNTPASDKPASCVPRRGWLSHAALSDPPPETARVDK